MDKAKGTAHNAAGDVAAPRGTAPEPSLGPLGGRGNTGPLLAVESHACNAAARQLRGMALPLPRCPVTP
jgi:hypothetical protein